MAITRKVKEYYCILAVNDKLKSIWKGWTLLGWKVLGKLPIEQRVMAAERMTICLECPHLVPAVNVCNQCGCQMNVKTLDPASSCAIKEPGQKKWESEKYKSTHSLNSP